MKKIIAAALSILVGAFGYTIVDSSVESRISSLESQVESLKGEIERYHSLTTSNDSFSTIETSEFEVTESITYPGTVSKMIWPTLDNSVIVEGYPSYENGAEHWGIDICIVDENGNFRDSNGNSLSYGKPIYAAQSGEVIIAGPHKSFGNYCIISHGNGIQTLYAHASAIEVSKGDIVKAGDCIGYIGSSGNTTGANLHFEVRVLSEDGIIERVNPLDYVSEPLN